MLDCLNQLIGVTANTEIPFYDTLDPDLQTAIAASSSPLFMDKLPGGIDLMAVDEAEYMESILKLGIQARDEAIQILEDEVLMAMAARYHPSKNRYVGDIGRRVYSATSSSMNNMQGIRLRMIEPIAGNILLQAIRLIVDGDATFNIYIAQCTAGDPALSMVPVEDGGNLLYTFPVTTTANNWAQVDMSATGPVKLPMEVEGIQPEYWIFWKRDEANGCIAKDNEIKCTTCMNKTADATLRQYMQYNGIALNDVSNLRNVNIDKNAHGLSLSVEVGCENDAVICREYGKKEAIALMMQWAARYKAGELWIEYIMKSGYVTKDSVQNREYLWGKRNSFRAEFDKRITAIANEMELGETNCYECKDDKIFKGLIKA